jgi:hypothetical protein
MGGEGPTSAALPLFSRIPLGGAEILFAQVLGLRNLSRGIGSIPAVDPSNNGEKSLFF